MGTATWLYQNSTTGADDIAVEIEVAPEPKAWALLAGRIALLVLIPRSRGKLGRSVIG